MTATGQNKTATLRIERFNPEADTEPAIEEMQVDLVPGKTILDALLEIKDEQDGSLTFRRSCRHGICGSCTMNINGTNRLACESALMDYVDESGVVTIRPLPSVPVIKDLVTDRNSFWEQYLRVKPWLIPPEVVPDKEFRVSPEDVSSLDKAERCINCGACYSACPVISIDHGFVGPHAMLKAFLRVSDTRDSDHNAHMTDMESLWDCTTCYMCVEQCPKQLEPGHVAGTLRSLFVEEGKVPRTLGLALTSAFRNKNPFEMMHADRLAWAEGLPLKDALAEPVDALYYVCCLACYDPRAQKIAQAMVKAMDAAGISLGTLGSEEACCGSEMQRVGEMGLFEMMVEELTESLNKPQAQQLVTASPHCFDVYAHSYPDLNLKSEHFTQYVSRLIDDGKLTLKGEIDKLVTYHDPCYLGIQNQVFDEPRSILQNIPGLELVEMDRSREQSLCCGGGGGRMWVEGSASAGHLSHERVREAVSTGAQVLATACPFCLNMLDDAVKTLALEDKLEVKDIMELVVESIEA